MLSDKFMLEQTIAKYEKVKEVLDGAVFDPDLSGLGQSGIVYPIDTVEIECVFCEECDDDCCKCLLDTLYGGDKRNRTNGGCMNNEITDVLVECSIGISDEGIEMGNESSCFEHEMNLVWVDWFLDKLHWLLENIDERSLWEKFKEEKKIKTGKVYHFDGEKLFNDIVKFLK